jgi:tartrate dehydrogenase/decarboxylase/D-malate dehydrogenase
MIFPMNKYQIAVLPGDGVGNEVMPSATRVLEAAADLHGGILFEWTPFSWNCEYYLQHGQMMPDDAIATLKF